MAQAVLAYLVTAAAAAWIVWSVLLPKSLKRRLKAGKAVPAGKGGCGGDCGCGD
jgi:hypothetical protein